MEKKYKLKMSDTFHKMSAIYFIVGLWKTKNGKTSFSRNFVCLLFLSCMLSVTVQAFKTDDNDESIFLVVIVLIGMIQIYRLYYIIWKQHKVIALMYTSSASGTDDHEAFFQASKKLTNFTMFVKCFLVTTFFAFVFTTFTPLVKEQLMFNIAFPLDYKTNNRQFWMAYVFVDGSFLISMSCCFVATMIWYIMVNFVIKFELLGNDFKNLGVIRTDGQEACELMNIQAKQTLYLRHLIEAVKNLESINELLEDFASTFSSLFLLQIVTSSLCICGGVYNLAFSSHDDPIQDGFYSVVLFYCFFDIFTVLYLGNEIMLSSDRLSYCLFESNWTEQTQTCKKQILIVVERLKQPQQIIVGKLFPLTLATFSIIVNRAYSIFNILQNFRK